MLFLRFRQNKIMFLSHICDEKSFIFSFAQGTAVGCAMKDIVASEEKERIKHKALVVYSHTHYLCMIGKKDFIIARENEKSCYFHDRDDSSFSYGPSTPHFLQTTDFSQFIIKRIRVIQMTSESIFF